MQVETKKAEAPDQRTYLSHDFEALRLPSKKLYITMDDSFKKNVSIEKTPPFKN